VEKPIAGKNNAPRLVEILNFKLMTSSDLHLYIGISIYRIECVNGHLVTKIGVVVKDKYYHVVNFEPQFESFTTTELSFSNGSSLQ